MCVSGYFEQQTFRPATVGKSTCVINNFTDGSMPFRWYQGSDTGSPKWNAAFVPVIIYTGLSAVRGPLVTLVATFGFKQEVHRAKPEA